MKLHKFESSGGSSLAVSQDRAGANLPKELGPWKYLDAIEIGPDEEPWIGDSPEAIVEIVQEDGFYIWPANTGKQDNS